MHENTCSLSKSVVELLAVQNTFDRAAISTLVAKLCCGDFITDMAADNLAFLQGDALDGPKFIGKVSNEFWIIVDNPQLTVTLVKVPNRAIPEYVAVSSCDSIIGFFGHGEAIVSVYSKDENICDEVFVRGQKFSLESRIKVRAGDVVQLESGRHGAHIELLSGNLGMAQASSKSNRNITWYFSSKDLTSSHSQSSLSEGTHIEYLLELMCLLVLENRNDHDTSIAACEALVRLAKSDSRHFVRWKTAKIASALSKQTFMEILNHLLNDNHPHVVNAARRTLANLERLET